jgi:chromosome segregation ATPase
MSRTDEPLDSVFVRHAVEDEHQQLMLEAARLQGEVAALRDQRAAAEAVTEHHRAELDAARREAAEALAAHRAAQARLEEIRRTVADLRARAEEAEDGRRRAEQERAAVIAVLGRKARRQLGDLAAATD